MVFKPSKEGRITVAQVLFPITLVAFVLFIMLAFQSSQILREREALTGAKTQQDKPLADAQKVQSQLDALAIGTKKLADQGNGSAETIINRMKQMGITVKDQAKPDGAATTAPATTPATAPAKPKKAEDTPE